MGWEIFFCFGVLILVSGGLVNNRPPDVLLLGAVVILAVVRIITPEEALAGFSNTSMLTVGALYIIAAALVFPFAVAIAGQTGVNPRPFVMCVTFAASASFLSPVSYQTNLMVYGPGGYRFTDFVRVGLPLNLLLLTCTTVLIPLIWLF